MKTERRVEALRAKLVRVGTPERAEGAKAYLKSDLEFYGVAAKPLRAAVRDVLAGHPDLTREALIEFVTLLWDEPVYEMRAAAVAVLERRQRELIPQDLEMLETMLRTSHTWALVDWICTKIVAPLVSGNPEGKEVLVRWSRDADFWLRRASILSLLPDLRAGAGDFDLFESFAVPMLDEREFFIRKALGWVLRDTSRRRPGMVADFVRRHRGRMSGLTYREATRNLPSEFRGLVDLNEM